MRHKMVKLLRGAGVRVPINPVKVDKHPFAVGIQRGGVHTLFHCAAYEPPGSGDTAGASAVHGRPASKRGAVGNRPREARAKPPPRGKDVDANPKGHMRGET